MGTTRPRRLRRARSRSPVMAGIAVAAASLSWGLPSASQTVLAQTTPSTAPAPPSAPSISWAIIPSPNTASSRVDDLTSVSCAPGPACMAVGHSFGSAERTLAESWDGSAWSVVPTPNAGDTTNPLISNVLNAVSCVSAQACTAVGEYVGPGAWHTLIESWDGSAWSIVPSPNVSPSLGNYLDGVSCLSARFCTAVGSFISGHGDETLVESWDGSRWSIVPSPDTGYIDGLLQVSCTSPSACTAVGESRPRFRFDRTLVETWDGKSWSVVASPDASTFTNILVDVSCPTPAQCVAVGTFFNGSEYQLLSMSWDGTSWSLLPNPGLHADGTGVTCSSATDCLEVGAGGLVNSWDGKTWTLVPTPPAPGPTHRLNAISCVPGSLCMAVGDYTEGTVAQTLVEEGCGLGGAAKSPSTGTFSADASYTGQLRTGATVTGAVCGLGIDWAMATRLSAKTMQKAGADRWGLVTSAYVNPPFWEVRLFLTSGGTSTCPSGYTYDWTITRKGTSQILRDQSCSVDVQVPKLGVYDVKARQFKGNNFTGKVFKNNQVVVKDFLIVGLGDSNGSGEGNSPFWFNQCNRGASSYQYMTAQYIQDVNPHTSVTFVFPACSGARIEHIWSTSYAGARSGPQLPTQIDQVKSVLGDRQVDAVIMSVGINNLYFGPLMAFCVETPLATPCESEDVDISTDTAGTCTYTADPLSTTTLARATQAAIDQLHHEYAQLHVALRRELNPAHIFITDYPDNARDQDGQVCNEKQRPFPHFEQTTWAWLEQTGTALNAEVNATKSYGWVPVTGIAEQFRDHGYCSKDSYFVSLSTAIKNWDFGGPFHAKTVGQQITFGETRKAVCDALYDNDSCTGLPPAS